jgi:hypothetical protein
MFISRKRAPYQLKPSVPFILMRWPLMKTRQKTDSLCSFSLNQSTQHSNQAMQRTADRPLCVDLRACERHFSLARSLILGLVRPMERRAITVAFVCLVSFSTSANQVVCPALTKESFVGVWEAIFPDRGHLLHMDIRSRGDSYLTWITLGTDCSCWRLVESNVRNGIVKLHFGRSCGGGSAEAIPELWIAGTGIGAGDQGEIDAQFCGSSWPDSPPARAEFFGVADGKHIFFRKGTWTRDFAVMSQTAERRIEELVSHGK